MEDLQNLIKEIDRVGEIYDDNCEISWRRRAEALEKVGKLISQQPMENEIYRKGLEILLRETDGVSRDVIVPAADALAGLDYSKNIKDMGRVLDALLYAMEKRWYEQGRVGLALCKFDYSLDKNIADKTVKKLVHIMIGGDYAQMHGPLSPLKNIFERFPAHRITAIEELGKIYGCAAPKSKRGWDYHTDINACGLLDCLFDKKLLEQHPLTEKEKSALIKTIELVLENCEYGRTSLIPAAEKYLAGLKGGKAKGN
jgi:hypothetical protein